MIHGASVRCLIRLGSIGPIDSLLLYRDSTLDSSSHGTGIAFIFRYFGSDTCTLWFRHIRVPCIYSCSVLLSIVVACHVGRIGHLGYNIMYSYYRHLTINNVDLLLSNYKHLD